MRHHNSVFHQLLKHLPWGAFERLVAEHGADARQRGFTTKTQLTAMIYAQLCGAVSLRDIEARLGSQQARLYHLGMGPVRRATLGEANAHRPVAVFSELFLLLARQASRALRRQCDGLTYLIDATPLRLNGLSAQWARFSAGVCGAKVHVVYDAHAEHPVYAAVSSAKLNDITAAKAMPITAGATYVFDLGYYDYGWWTQLDGAGCRIVTRLKRNTPLREIEERPVGGPVVGGPVAADGSILSDRTGYLPARLPGRANPFVKRIREIRVKIDTGAVLRILTNDLDAPPQEIADLYKQRWTIELFFRWIKQTLQLTRFFGTSENAVRIQLAVALITFLMLRLAHAAQTAVVSPLAFARLIDNTLMERRDLRNLPAPNLSPPINPNQLALL
jgi:hypothetical protein